jgi:hypothetical protein
VNALVLFDQHGVYGQIHRSLPLRVEVDVDVNLPPRRLSNTRKPISDQARAVATLFVSNSLESFLCPSRHAVKPIT